MLMQICLADTYTVGFPRLYEWISLHISAWKNTWREKKERDIKINLHTVTVKQKSEVNSRDNRREAVRETLL